MRLVRLGSISTHSSSQAAPPPAACCTSSAAEGTYSQLTTIQRFEARRRHSNQHVLIRADGTDLGSSGPARKRIRSTNCQLILKSSASSPCSSLEIKCVFTYYVTVLRYSVLLWLLLDYALLGYYC